MEKCYLGIDPGKTGAVALIQSPDVKIFDWDGVISTAAKIRDWKNQHNIIGAFLENVHAFPEDGVSSAFKFGRNFGAWQGILSATGIELKLISPKQWRKGLFLPGDRRPLKKRSIDAARGLFPDVADKYFAKMNSHNRAEAALIAYQAERFFEL